MHSVPFVLITIAMIMAIVGFFTTAMPGVNPRVGERLIYGFYLFLVLSLVYAVSITVIGLI